MVACTGFKQNTLKGQRNTQQPGVVTKTILLGGFELQTNKVSKPQQHPNTSWKPPNPWVLAFLEGRRGAQTSWCLGGEAAGFSILLMAFLLAWGGHLAKRTGLRTNIFLICLDPWRGLLNLSTGRPSLQRHRWLGLLEVGKDGQQSKTSWRGTWRDVSDVFSFFRYSTCKDLNKFKECKCNFKVEANYVSRFRVRDSLKVGKRGRWWEGEPTWKPSPGNLKAREQWNQ